MSTRFESKDQSQRRVTRLVLLLTAHEAEAIQHQASIRNLSTSEFVRRAALGRKADVSFEMQIVDQLMDIIKIIRQFHESMLKMGATPPEEIWGPLIDQALDAMLRISK